MKSWSKILIGLSVLAMLMVGCKPDEKNEKSGNGKTGEESTEAVVYMAVNVTLPPAGHANGAKAGSANLKPDGETGQEYENNVSNMLIVLATYPDNKFITYGTVTDPTAVTTGTNAGTVKAVSTVNRSGLDSYYSSTASDDPNLGKVYVYVFCNYTQPLLNAITDVAGRADDGSTPKVSSEWMHAVADITASGNENIWGQGEFLMSNVTKEQRKIPESLKTWQTHYAKDETTAFNLSGNNTTGEDNTTGGTIRVHRSMARFDLKDGSLSNDRKYIIETKGTGDQDLTVELVRVALVNQSKTFYYLQHVTDKDKTVVDLDKVLDRTNQVVCGEEFYDFDNGKHTYVVDADADQAHKKVHQDNEHIAPETLATYFKHTLFDNSGAITSAVRGQWQSADLATVLANNKPEGSEYAIWTYTTENAVPHTNQRVGVSTGIVFKGKLGYTSGVNETLKKAIEGDYGAGGDKNYVKELEVNGGGKKHYPILYTFGEGIARRLYVGWNDQVAAKVAEGYADVKGSIAYAAKTKNYPENAPTKSPDDLFQELIAVKGRDGEAAALAAFKKSATDAGFTLYEASNDADAGDGDETTSRVPHGPGYYCYYFYWNRHNADNIFGTMSPMEFAVVRNNVYKLSVKTIKRFGHPRIAENDPDKLTPDTPCEKDDLYMSVDIEVAPWVVRENDIEF